MKTTADSPLQIFAAHMSFFRRAIPKANSSKQTHMRHPAIAVWIGLLVFPLSVCAVDSPQWGGTSSKNMVSLERNLPQTFVPGEGSRGEIDLATTRNVKWVVKTGAFSCGTPTIAGGKVFIGGMIDRQGVLKCFDDLYVHYTLGDRRRDDSINKLNDGLFVGLSEIIATPVFYQNRVYVAIGRDPDHGRGRGALLCLATDKSGDASQSARIWTYQGLDRSLSTVSIADGLLYIADVSGRVHCLDLESGLAMWVYDTKSRTIGSTMVADGKVYLATEKHLNVLAAGREMKLLSRIDLGAASWVTPVAANGVLYIASKNYLWAVKQSTGTL